MKQAILQLVASYLAGSTVNALATQFNVSVTTVHAHLKRHDVSLRPFRKLKPEYVTSDRPSYVRQLDLRHRRKRLGVSWNTVHTVLREAGVVPG